MRKSEDNLNEIEALKAKLFEKQRIEDFLRSENKELWAYIKNIQKLPLFNYFVIFAQNLRKIFAPFHFNSLIKSNNTSIKLDNNDSNTISKQIDVLFLVPSNRIEIGGIQTAFKLTEDLSKRGLVSHLVSIEEDPSSDNLHDTLFIKKENLKDVDQIKILIACGAESISLCNEISFKFNSKIILFMQGADHYFTPKWEDSKKFVAAIKNYDLIVTVSYFLSELARQFSPKNLICIPLGFDKNIFNMQEKVKNNQIVVACRSSFEKGLRILLPQIPEIRKLGWRVVGFGDLANPQSAEVFDEFYGRIEKHEMHKIFLNSKILLDPSIMEGLGLIAIEAAASGVIPVITKRHSYDGLFEGKDFPFIEIDDYQNPNVVINAINQAAKANSLRASQMVQHLNWDTSSLKFYEIIKNILTS